MTTSKVTPFIRNKCKKSTNKDYNKINNIWDKCLDIIRSEIEHCGRVEENLERLISDLKLTDSFSDEEYFILSVASCSHDLGKSRETERGYNPKKHGEYSAKIIKQDHSNLDISNHYVDILSKIVRYHSTGDLEIFKEHQKEHPINIQKLASLFKLADTLDSTSKRINELQLKAKGRKLGKKEFARSNMFEWIIDPFDPCKIKMIVTGEAILQKDLVQKAIEMMNDELKTSVIHLAGNDFPFWIDGPQKDENTESGESISMSEILSEITKFSQSSCDVDLLEKEIEDAERNVIEYFLENLELNRKKVIVLGDVMLDHIMKVEPANYLHVTTHDVTDDYSFAKNPTGIEEKRFGGAANIAYCCSALSDVILFGIIGDDGEGYDMKKIAEKEKGTIKPEFIPITKYKTITKIYLQHFIGNQLNKKVRMNREFNEKNGQQVILEKKLILKKKFIDIITSEINGIVFKDHQKGFLSHEFLDEIIPLINSKIINDPNFLVAIDPKYDWKKFSKIDKIHAIFPNIKEAAAGIFRPSSTINEEEREKVINEIEKKKELSIGEYKKLANDYPNIDCFVVKADEKGASLFYPKGNKIISMPATHVKGPGEIGCGDVFDAYFINSLLHEKIANPNISHDDYCLFLRLANIAAGIKLTQPVSEKIPLKTMKDELGIFVT